MEMNLRVLFVGQNWHGSNSTSCLRAFQALGCDVLEVDDYHYFPRWESKGLKAVRRMLTPAIVNEFGRFIKREARIFKPHLVFVFKGEMVLPEVLRDCRRQGALTFNFYPDWDFYGQYRWLGNNYPACVREYDCVFTPKSYHFDLYRSAGARRVEFLPYAYDPWCHFPVEVSPEENGLYASDVVFVGTWGKRRAQLMEDLVRLDDSMDLTIWGNQWDKLAVDSPLRRHVKMHPAYGAMQGKVFGASRIALAFLTNPDLHTARTFEIPAYGAFMLAERTEEHTKFFREGEEIACFNGLEELREKIDYYLAHDEERRAIARAGFKKVTTQGNSYVDRMQYVLKIYQEMAGKSLEPSRFAAKSLS
jgi:spore maturation protein CgeB